MICCRSRSPAIEVAGPSSRLVSAGGDTEVGTLMDGLRMGPFDGFSTTGKAKAHEICNTAVDHFAIERLERASGCGFLNLRRFSPQSDCEAAGGLCFRIFGDEVARQPQGGAIRQPRAGHRPIGWSPWVDSCNEIEAAPTGRNSPFCRMICLSANLAPLGLLARIRHLPRAGALGYRIPPLWGCSFECRDQKRDTNQKSTRASI